MSRVNKILLFVVFALASTGLFVQQTWAHCQIPCGIYDDHARVAAMLEDAATVEKSIQLISELTGKSDAQSQNQLVRWVMNKENHAQKIIASISDYFLTQRVKTSQDDYVERLKKTSCGHRCGNEGKTEQRPGLCGCLERKYRSANSVLPIALKVIPAETPVVVFPPVHADNKHRVSSSCSKSAGNYCILS